MRSRPLLLFALAALAMVLTPVALQAQDRLDRIEYLDRSAKPPKPVTRSGAISSETPVKVIILTPPNNRPLEIAPGDIIDVIYDGEPEDSARARGAERDKAREKHLERALSIYQDIGRKPIANKLIQAHVRFKIAKLTAQLAETATPADRLRAIDLLRAFKRDYPDGRQTIECLDLLSRMLLQEGQSAQEVVDAFRQLKAKYKDNKELAARCDVFESQLLVQEAQGLFRKDRTRAQQKYQQAQQALEAMIKTADPATALDIQVNLAECKAALGKLDEALKDLQAILDAADDDRTRATAHLGRADCYRLNDRFKEAMWDYLWVDVLYNQDREQWAKAVYHLIEVFDKLNDGDRARLCRELLNDKLRDTRYQKLLANQTLGTKP